MTVATTAASLEKAVAEKLAEAKLFEAEIGKGLSALRTPASTVGVLAGKFHRDGGYLKHDLNVTVELWVKNIQSGGESFRRAEMHSLVLTVVQYLFEQKFGLEIQSLEPGPWREATSEDELKAGLMHVEIGFSSSCIESVPSADDSAAALTSLVAGYYLADPVTGELPSDSTQESDLTLSS